MNLKRLRHSVLAVLFGLLAVTVINLGQVQLAGSVVAAAATDVHDQSAAVEHGPDCPMGKTGGHTHRGHADCAVCGIQAVLTSVTLPDVVLFAPPVELASATLIAMPSASAPVSPPLPTSLAAHPSPPKSRSRMRAGLRL